MPFCRSCAGFAGILSDFRNGQSQKEENANRKPALRFGSNVAGRQRNGCRLGFAGGAGIGTQISGGRFVNAVPGLLRLSWCIGGGMPETVAEKQVPELYISGCAVAVPPGVFYKPPKRRKMP